MEFFQTMYFLFLHKIAHCTIVISSKNYERGISVRFEDMETKASKQRTVNINFRFTIQKDNFQILMNS